MTRPMVERLHIQNYGCIKDAEFKLSPLHALIGPNDSGKSTVLRALRTLSLLAVGEPSVMQQPEGETLQRALLANAGAVCLETQIANKTWKLEVLPTRGEKPLSEKTFEGSRDTGAQGNARRFSFVNGRR